MKAKLLGTIHGRTIELQSDSGLAEGQLVSVNVEPVSTSEGNVVRHDRLRRAAGSWCDDPQGLDEFLEWNRQQRKGGRGDLEP